MRRFAVRRGPSPTLAGMSRRGVWGGVLLVVFGMVGVALGACAFAQAMASAVAALGSTWGAGLGLLFDRNADFGSALGGWPEVVLWLSGAIALFAVGWGFVIGGMNGLLRARSGGPA